LFQTVVVVEVVVVVASVGEDEMDSEDEDISNTHLLFLDRQHCNDRNK
jgi:hypothetical protein